MIKPATLSDIDKITSKGGLFIDASISSRFISYDAKGCRDILKSLMYEGLLRVWLYRVGDKIAGWVGLLISPNIYNPKETLGDIYFIDVFPEYRKQGIAKKLMRTVEDEAKKIGVVSLTVSFKKKPIADKLVENMGYTMFEYKIIKRIT